MKHLPLEIQLAIAAKMSLPDLLHLHLVSKELSAVAAHPYFWRKLVQRHFPNDFKILEKRELAQPNKMNWFVEFGTRYRNHYSGLTYAARAFLWHLFAETPPTLSTADFDVKLLLETFKGFTVFTYLVNRRDSIINEWLSRAIIAYFKRNPQELTGLTVTDKKKQLLYWTITRKPKIDFQALLISENANNTFLHRAVYENNAAIVPHLLQMGIDLAACNTAGHHAIEEAMILKRPELIRALLQHAPPEQVRTLKFNHWPDHPETIDYLQLCISLGADIHDILYLALKHKKLEYARQLLAECDPIKLILIAKEEDYPALLQFLMPFHAPVKNSAPAALYSNTLYPKAMQQKIWAATVILGLEIARIAHEGRISTAYAASFTRHEIKFYIDFHLRRMLQNAGYFELLDLPQTELVKTILRRWENVYSSPRNLQDLLTFLNALSVHTLLAFHFAKMQHYPLELQYTIAHYAGTAAREDKKFATVRSLLKKKQQAVLSPTVSFKLLSTAITHSKLFQALLPHTTHDVSNDATLLHLACEQNLDVAFPLIARGYDLNQRHPAGKTAQEIAQDFKQASARRMNKKFAEHKEEYSHSYFSKKVGVHIFGRIAYKIMPYFKKHAGWAVMLGAVALVCLIISAGFGIPPLTIACIAITSITFGFAFAPFALLMADTIASPFIRTAQYAAKNFTAALQHSLVSLKVGLLPLYQSFCRSSWTAKLNNWLFPPKITVGNSTANAMQQLTIGQDATLPRLSRAQPHFLPHEQLQKSHRPLFAQSHVKIADTIRPARPDLRLRSS